MNTLKISTLTILVVGLLCFTVQAQVPGEDAMILDMPLDNVEIYDATETAYDVVPHCPFSNATDRFGNPDGALHLDGDKDWIEVHMPDDAYPVEYTLSFWVKRATGGTASPLLFSQRNNSVYVRVEGESSTLGPGRLTSTNGVVYNAIPLDKWTHVVTMFTADMMSYIYINGELVDEAPYGVPLTNGANPLIIGAHWKIKNFFKGDLDDIRLFNRALDREEIATLAEIDYLEPEECIPISQCETCQEVVECESYNEPTEVLDGTTKKAFLHFNENKGTTALQVHMDVDGIPVKIGEGPVEVKVQFLQNGELVEFTSYTVLKKKGQRNLMD